MRSYIYNSVIQPAYFYVTIVINFKAEKRTRMRNGKVFCKHISHSLHRSSTLVEQKIQGFKSFLSKKDIEKKSIKTFYFFLFYLELQNNTTSTLDTDYSLFMHN